MPRKRFMQGTTLQLALEEQWAAALAAGTAIVSSVPPIPPNVDRWPLPPDLDRLESLLAIPLPLSGQWKYPNGRTFPHSLAIHHTSGPIVGVIIEQKLNGTWGAGYHAIRAWDHAGGVWCGTLIEDAQGGAAEVRLRRRASSAMCKPIWFGPAHICPDGFRPAGSHK